MLVAGGGATQVVIPSREETIEKLEKLMGRIGLFSVIYLVPALFTAFCVAYQVCLVFSLRLVGA